MTIPDDDEKIDWKFHPLWWNQRHTRTLRTPDSSTPLLPSSPFLLPHLPYSLSTFVLSYSSPLHTPTRLSLPPILSAVMLLLLNFKGLGIPSDQSLSFISLVQFVFLSFPLLSSLPLPYPLFHSSPILSFLFLPLLSPISLAFSLCFPPHLCISLSCTFLPSSYIQGQTTSQFPRPLVRPQNTPHSSLFLLVKLR